MGRVLSFALGLPLLGVAVFAQPNPVSVTFNNPSGLACQSGQATLYAAATTTMFTCQSGTFVQVTGGGGASIAPFTTDGTNVTLPTGTLSVGNALSALSVNGWTASDMSKNLGTTSMVRLMPPAAFPWQDAPIWIYKMGNSYATTFDASVYAPGSCPSGGVAATGVYYVATTGNDSNSGLTSLLPLRSVATAMNKSGATTVCVAPGWYSSAYTVRLYGPTIAQAVIGTGPGVYLSQDTAGLSYTPGSGYWTTTDAHTVDSVIDTANTTAYGDFLRYTPVGSSGAVASTPGSWYYTGTTLYVNTIDGRAPDASIKVYDANNFYGLWHSNPVLWYLEKVNVIGSGSGVQVVIMTAASPGYSTLVMKDCYIGLGEAMGLETTGSGLVILQNVTAAANQDDGLDYQSGILNVVEVGVTSRDNGGKLNGDTTNGSTSHVGTQNIVRLNSSYLRTDGPPIADVGGAQSWNVNITAGASTAPTGYNSTIVANGAGTAIWVDNPTFSTPATGYDLNASPSASIYYTPTWTPKTTGGGTLAAYAENWTWGSFSPIIAAPGGNVPVWNRYTITKVINNANGCTSTNGCWWVVAGAAGTSGTIVAASATTNQAITFLAAPANAALESVRLKTVTACAGITAITVASLGTTASATEFASGLTYDLTAAPGPTNLLWITPTDPGLTAAATNWTVTVSGGAGNVSSITAGCGLQLDARWGVQP